MIFMDPTYTRLIVKGCFSVTHFKIRSMFFVLRLTSVRVFPYVPFEILKQMSESEYPAHPPSVRLFLVVSTFMYKSFLHRLVINRRCASCNHLNVYDGCEDAILNMKGFLIHHQVLRKYLRAFMVGNR